jgi:hypothetical protein
VPGIQQHHVRLELLRPLQPDVAILGFVDVEVGNLQRHPDQLTDVGLVFHDQHTFHEWALQTRPDSILLKLGAVRGMCVANGGLFCPQCTQAWPAGAQL